MSLLKGYSMIVFGGGACVIPFLNLFSNSKNILHTTSVTHQVGGGNLESQTAADNSGVTRESQPKSPKETVQVRISDNCIFNSELAETVTSLLESPTYRYLAFACDNSGQHESLITSKWTLWIPEKILREGAETFKENQRINIKTQTKDLNLDPEDSSNWDKDKYETTFTSDGFVEGPLTGTWGRKTLGDNYDDIEGLIYIVKITNPKTLEDNSIYLKLKW